MFSLNQVTLLVCDVAVNKEFFQRLGFKLIVDAPPHYARFELPGGNPPATFSLDLDPEADVHAKQKAQVFFELPSKLALDEYCARMEREQGFEFLEPPTDKDYLWREARLKTPEGHDVRFYFAGVNRLDPPWKV
ncbi:hypothetical protein BASA81_003210 [Batrachochytrium salamandrivorans]|nr:hypothetical protein BASA81_003210 [Batrachochytrium salamandrivorans]